MREVLSRLESLNRTNHRRGQRLTHRQPEPKDEELSKVEMLRLSGQIERSRKEWIAFADAMFQKAIDHLKEHPEDALEPWRVPALTTEFWQHRIKDEQREYQEATDPIAKNLEILDIANILFFEWKRRAWELTA